MDLLNDTIARLLALFYSVIPSYGMAIILLTLTVMIVLTPLTLKGTRSMIAMQRLQPELKKIQNQYKDDREKLNEELLVFYRENNINPLGGCLPLLVQLPVFIVLFSVLRGLTRRAPVLGVYTGWLAGKLGLSEAPTAPPEALTERTFDPAYLDPDSDMYQALSQSTSMNFLGLDLSASASQTLSEEGVLIALPYLVLIVLVGFTGWFQQRQIQGRNQNAVQNPQQQMIARIMPIFLPVISFSLPAGLVLYFLVSNLYRIGQQAWITRTMFGDGSGSDDTEGASKEAGGSSGASSNGAGAATGPVAGSNGGLGAKLMQMLGGSAGGATADEDSGGSVAAPARHTEGKGRPTPKRGASTTDSKGGKRAGGGSRKGGSGKSGSGKKKTFTSDPAAKGRSGKGKAAPTPKIEPRGRKKRT